MIVVHRDVLEQIAEIVAIDRAGTSFGRKFFDRLATFSRTPDYYFDEMRTEYESDDGLRVPAATRA